VMVAVAVFVVSATEVANKKQPSDQAAVGCIWTA
jgi:hypothetical protein